MTEDITPGRPYFAVELVLIRTIEDQPHVLLVTEHPEPDVHLEALPGGLLRHGEGLADAAARLLAAAAGLEIHARELFHLETYERSYHRVAGWSLANAYMVTASVNSPSPTESDGPLSPTWLTAPPNAAATWPTASPPSSATPPTSCSSRTCGRRVAPASSAPACATAPDLTPHSPEAPTTRSGPHPSPPHPRGTVL